MSARLRSYVPAYFPAGGGCGEAPLAMAQARLYVTHRHPTETWGPDMVPATDKQALTLRLARLQGGICALCGAPLLFSAKFGTRKGLTLDHVWPRNRSGPAGPRRAPEGRFANKVAAHGRCNAGKGDRAPTGCELVWLMAVNARRFRKGSQMATELGYQMAPKSAAPKVGQVAGQHAEEPGEQQDHQDQAEDPARAVAPGARPSPAG